MIPGNIQRVVNHVLKRKTRVANDQIIMLAGGTDEEWGQYLRGPRTQAIIYAVNRQLKEQNYALVSMKMMSERWQLVTRAEMHRRKASFTLEHADGKMKRAYHFIEQILNDERARKDLRLAAKAWHELFEEPECLLSRKIMLEFCQEIVDDAEDYKRNINKPPGEIK